MAKRSHDEMSEDGTSGHESEDESPSKRLKEADLSVLQSIKEQYMTLNEDINIELQLAKEKYLTEYMKNTMTHLPITSKVLDFFKDMLTRKESFTDILAVVKICINTTLGMKCCNTFNSVYEMFSNLGGQLLHKKFILRYLEPYVPT